MAELYLADTNVYVGAANEPAFRQRFEAFIRDHGPLVVSAVVVAEVLVGIADAARHPAAVRALTAGAVPLAPTPEDWIAAAAIVTHLGGEAVTKSRSFWNDVLLAAQCSRLGAVLLTHNASDFRRLGRHVPLRAVGPFP